jgi:hypothetical protein
MHGCAMPNDRLCEAAVTAGTEAVPMLKVDGQTLLENQREDTPARDRAGVPE